MKLPKLHLVCVDDELRPVMQCVMVGKDQTFASDAHILVRHKTSEIFKDEFVATIPDDGIMIPRKAWYVMCRRSTFKISLSDDKKLIQLHQLDESVISYKLFNEKGYPDVNKVIPNPKDCKPINEIGLNSSLLDRLADGLGCNQSILRLKFFDKNKAIYVSSSFSDYESAIGIIMPTNIEDKW